MHIYEDTERSVDDWNSVDVEIDGQLQHGHVIGLEEKPRNGNTPLRLIVDFGGPSQQAVLVEYGKIWDCSAHRSTRVHEGDEVEVLLHEGRDRPWKWYRGKMLIRRFNQLYHMALVEVMVNGQSRRELLPWQQIRDRAGEAVKPQPIAAGHFVMRTCSVPNGFWTLQPSVASWLLRRMQFHLHLQFVKVLSQEMHCLMVRRRPEGPLRDEDVAANFEFARMEFGGSVFCGKRPKTIEEWDGERKREKPLCLEEGDLPLSLNVLKEVFLSLDTIDQQRCRRTCQLWETMLSSLDVRSVVRVSVQNPSESAAVMWDRNYFLYACIFKLITPATRTVSIRGAMPPSRHRWNLRVANESVSLIKKVLGGAGLRLDRLIMDQRSMKIAYDYPWTRLSFEVFAHLSKLLSCCDHVILKSYVFALSDENRAPLMEFRIPAAVFTREPIDHAQIADMLEQHLSYEGPPIDVQHIAQCLASRIDMSHKANNVKKILERYQSGDPRPSAYYRKHPWTLNNVAGVDVAKLNRMCLYALWRYIQDWGPAFAHDNARTEPFMELSYIELDSLSSPSEPDDF
ncbi:uncharacterized protein LOC129595953 [Paramacrobiotus metropolitanus]|uniref:uncharacterized protein LOC129595953 n=1 Tax=Paramacrobiotus metropolitanus TaxID=2943436 RepID=UPI002445E9F2|nr:uncharacterized protein LOC129595953 [Paramacrobiotus metropolitanus]